MDVLNHVSWNVCAYECTDYGLGLIVGPVGTKSQ